MRSRATWSDRAIQAVIVAASLGISMAFVPRGEIAVIYGVMVGLQVAGLAGAFRIWQRDH